MVKKNYQIGFLSVKIQKESMEVEKEGTRLTEVPVKITRSFLEPKIEGYMRVETIYHYKTTEDFAKVWGKLCATVHCTHCQTEFSFEYDKTEHKNWYYGSEFESNLEKEFRDNPGIPPAHKCPKCGRYQNWMIQMVASPIVRRSVPILWFSIIVLWQCHIRQTF